MPGTPEPSTYAKGVTCDGIPWKPEWNDIVAGALDDYGSHLLDGSLAKDQLTALCPKYFTATGAQKKAVWALIIASISCPESSFNPADKYHESFGVWSLGLLQLSYEDYPGHARCELRSDGKAKATSSTPATGNAYDPKANIRCGIAILDDGFAKGHKLFQPTAWYWSTLVEPATDVKAEYWRYAKQFSFCL